ncbi:MAG TPA: high-potential iron-sulfur protein [Acidiphilium sp.]|nr:high-potential iron-sulfur protein [Acidiphilium sp.]
MTLLAPTRRHAILAAAAGLAAVATRARAAVGTAAPVGLGTMVPSVSKGAVGYVDRSRHGEVCGACVWFKPPAPGSTASHCHLVAGRISPAGWCEAWMKRG